MAEKGLTHLGNWDVKLVDLGILEDEIRNNPIVANYFQGPKAMNLVEPEQPEEVKEVYRKIDTSERTVNVLNMGIKSILNMRKIIKNNKNMALEEGT